MWDWIWLLLALNPLFCNWALQSKPKRLVGDYNNEILANSIKWSTQQGEKKEQRERTQVQAKRIKPKVHHKGALEQSCVKPLPPPPNRKKHIKQRKGWETWKGRKPSRAFTCKIEVVGALCKAIDTLCL
jgi:hypothetical protein